MTPNPKRGDDIRTVKISEEGQGFPEVGEIIYDAPNGTLWKVKKIRSGIQTRQWQANWIIADVTYYGTPFDISEKKFEELRNVGIEDEEEESPNPKRGELIPYDKSEYEFFQIVLGKVQEEGERYRIVQEESGKYPDGTPITHVRLFVEGGARGRAEAAMRGATQRHFDGKLYIETASYDAYEGKSPNPKRGEITIADVDAAIRDEIDAIQMYGSWADRLTDPALKVVFQNIAREEMKHKGALEELALILRQRRI